MIRILIASLFALAAMGASAFADTRDVYTVSNIEVDERAGSLIEARELAMASARVQGARVLIDRITLAEDRMKTGGMVVDTALADRLSAAVDVQEETAGAGRYKGTLAVVYNPRMVRAHLDSLSVPYVDTQAPKGLLVPLAGSAGLDAAWREALGTGRDETLSPFVTANSPGYSAYSDWLELSPEATAQGARRGILADLSGRDGAWQVTVSTVTAAGTQRIGTTPYASSLEVAVDRMVTLLDENWKETSIIRSGERTPATASVRYTSLAEWNTLRGALARSPLVSEFRIEAIARDGALVAFSYAGDARRLQNDLLQRGVSLSENEYGWIVRSAVSASGEP
jgi:hypothetical protein